MRKTLYMKIFEIDIFWLHIAPSYYGLMYVLAFVYGIWFLKKNSDLSQKQQDSLFLYLFLWVVLGGRIGYMLFYNGSELMADPLSLFRVWEGWMSFHGGFLWVIFVSYIFSLKKHISFWKITDLLAQIAPVWLFFGRIGNYLNKELLWFAYTGPLAVVTPTGSYFPSPLLEAFLEGVVLWILLNKVYSSDFPGKLSVLFLIYYGIFRCGVELFIRTPDTQIGYYFWFLTQGFLLSFPMIVLWGGLYYFLKRKYASI